jgi:hypothetical protein
VTVVSPAFDATLLQLVGATRSPVAGWTFVSGMLGIVLGFVLTIGTVRQWPGLIVGGKPLMSMPAFLIIVFELTILCASIGAVVSFLIASSRARRTAGPVRDATTTDSRFALVVDSPAAVAEANQLMQSVGAIEWRAV